MGYDDPRLRRPRLRRLSHLASERRAHSVKLRAFEPLPNAVHLWAAFCRSCMCRWKQAPRRLACPECPLSARSRRHPHPRDASPRVRKSWIERRGGRGARPPGATTAAAPRPERDRPAGPGFALAPWPEDCIIGGRRLHRAAAMAAGSDDRVCSNAFSGPAPACRRSSFVPRPIRAGLSWSRLRRDRRAGARRLQRRQERLCRAAAAESGGRPAAAAAGDVLSRIDRQHRAVQGRRSHGLHCEELPVIHLWISARSVLKFRVRAGVPRHR